MPADLPADDAWADSLASPWIGICPIGSHEVLDAYRDLGARRSNVVFLTVNINEYNYQVADVATFTAEQGLKAVPT